MSPTLSPSCKNSSGGIRAHEFITGRSKCGMSRACQILQRIADASGNREPVWKGSALPTKLQGIKVLGTPLTLPNFVSAHLDRVLSGAWALLFHSAGGRANYQVRVVRLASTEAFAMGARRSVVAMHVRDSPGALGHRSLRQRHCLLAPGAGRVGTSERSPI